MDNVNTIIITAVINATEQQSVLLSLLIQNQFENNNSSIKELLSHLDLKISGALMINEILDPIVSREWISPKKDIKSNPLSEYLITPKLIRSVLSGKMESFEKAEISTSFQLLNRFHTKMTERTSLKITYRKLIEWTSELIEENEHTDLAAFILNLKMTPEDTIQFMFICLQHYLGNESCEYDTLFRDLIPSKDEQYHIRNAYKNGSHFLLKSELLKETVSNEMFGGISYKLTEKAVRAFDKDAIIKDCLPDGILRPLEPVSIAEQKLIFGEKEQEMVHKLHEMLSTNKFDQLTERLQHQGMKKGISVLLYGHPGTGKTETVLQLGKNSNRFVLLADASKIRSKWVGETAKNIKSLFDEYRKAIKDFEQTPILLFNEADAIIGKRHNVTDRGDQEMNTMQNILLEELENFEGIFIATTNLVDNLDKAFDRRFLYKIRFEKPGAATTTQIWKSKFPDLSKSMLKKLTEKFEISGAQIENIRKKTIVDKLLNDNTKFNYQYFESLIMMEISLEMKNQNRNPIGFLAK